MSQDGAPPPGPDEGHQPPPAGQPEPPAYNPYPDSWDTAPTGNHAFHAGPPPPPDNPYARPGAYGVQPPAYGAQRPPIDPAANPYAGPVNTRPSFGFGGYASWLTRVAAFVIDYVCGVLAAAPALIGYLILLLNTTTTTNPDGTTTSDYSGSLAAPVVLILIGSVTGIAFFVWNICIRQGRTGASVGKSVLAVRLVNSDLRPIGPGWSFLRYLLHIVDGICYIGYLWPIWDSRKQTFADKIMSTFVIQATTQEPRPF